MDFGFHSFPKDISLKMNVIVRLEFEHTFNHVAVHCVLDTMPQELPPFLLDLIKLLRLVLQHVNPYWVI